METKLKLVYDRYCSLLRASFSTCNFSIYMLSIESYTLGFVILFYKTYKIIFEISYFLSSFPTGDELRRRVEFLGQHRSMSGVKVAAFEFAKRG